MTAETADAVQAAPAAAVPAWRILVVDDDRIDRLAVLRALRKAGMAAAVEEADSAETALYSAARTPYDCIILDFNIPGSDGLHLLRQLRSRHANVPVIMLTGQGDEQVAVELMKAGAADYLPKTALTPERLASSLRYAIELSRAAEMTRRAAEEVAQSALRFQFLAEASAVLTRSLDPRDTSGEVARLAVPYLADYCIIYRVSQSGDPEPVAAVHHDEQFQEAMAVIGQQHRPPRDHPHSPVAAVVRTEERVLLEALDDDLLRAITDNDEVLAALRQIAPSSVLVLPLVARQRLRGAMALGRCRERATFTQAELDLAEDLALRTALAFDNAGLFEAARQARHRTDMLQHVTATLARALPLDEVANLLTQEVLRALDADTAWVALVDSERTELRMIAHAGYSAETISRWTTVPLSVASPSRDALTDGGDRWFTSTGELEEAYPSFVGASHGEREALGVLPLVAGGEAFGVIAVGFRDVHSFSREERALARALAGQCAQAIERARLYDAEREARERAEAANRIKSEFLARMSHDLRTPLNAIGGYAELVEMGLRGPVSTEQQEAMGRIQRAKSHLLTLINDILSFAKLEAGQITIVHEEVPLHSLFLEVGQLIEPQITAKGLVFEQVPPGDIVVRADRERLLQVLINLLTNALKFTETGTISLRSEKAGREVHIHVADTGCGIDEDRLPTIFDPFVQAGTAATENREGVGLGLAISRELIRLMGGHMSVRSETGRGSTFTATVPAAATS